MYEITKKEYLSKTSVLMNVKAPLVAAKAEAGQFIILRSDKDGERLKIREFCRIRTFPL